MLDVIQVPTKCYRQIIIHENRMLTRTLTSFWEKMRQYFKFVGMKIKFRGGEQSPNSWTGGYQKKDPNGQYLDL